MDRHYVSAISIPAGTQQLGPQSTSIPLENGYLVEVEVTIPPGHNGLTGVRIEQSRQQILPWGNNSFISGDNYNRVYPINTEIGVNAIRARTYNLDIFVHTIYLRLHVRSLESQGSVPGGNPVDGAIGVIDGGLPTPGDVPDVELPDMPSLPGGIPLPPVPPSVLLPPSNENGVVRSSMKLLLLMS